MIESSQGRVYHLARIHHHACGTTLKVDADSVEYMTRWMPRKRQEQPESSSSSCSMMCLFTVSSCLSRGPSTASREKTTPTSSREITGLPPSAMLRWRDGARSFLRLAALPPFQRATASPKASPWKFSAWPYRSISRSWQSSSGRGISRTTSTRPERAASAPSNGIPSHCW